uniref:Uncharacterized protein n=1 Tax=Meloidogyne enterolobii TaxID=390850 RepID=A0A6V7XP54_MELEN|nr:unnamed protein product [Meloidogyne enterolobii]
MLTANTVTSDKAGLDLASHNFKELYPDACDVTIEKGYIELRYTKGSKGCTMDLLSTDSSNINKIKFKAGVRGNADGKLNDCLEAGDSLAQSFNNVLPFVYSVDNKGIEDLNNRQYNGSGADCKNAACKIIDGKCKRHTSLQVSWSQSDGEVYAHTYLIGENNKGLSQSKKPESESMTLDLVISTASGFTMEYAKDEGFDASTKAVCVHRSTPLFEPKTWKITNDGEFKDKHLLVFSLLRQNASYTYKDSKLAVPPNGPECELFIQFDVNYYKMLIVNPQTTTPPTTSTTTEDPPVETSDPTETTTDPSGSSTTTSSTTDFSSITTTSRATTRRPEQQECGGGLYIAIALAVGLLVGLIVAVLVWLWMKDKAEKDKKKWKQDAERAEEKRLLALYKADQKIRGKKNVGTFDVWKKNRKESDETTAFEMGSVDDLCAIIWKRVEKDHAKAKMQFIVDQFEKHRDNEVYAREYEPEKSKKGYDAVGNFQYWKRMRKIYPFEVIDGTSTALEYGAGKKPYDKPYLPGAVDESIPETE